MKKVIAILLSVICLFTAFAVAVSAENSDDGATLLYGITYEAESTGVKVMYSPRISLKFPGEGYVTVTKDTPISIDNDFVAWKDEDGKLYYEGDKVLVDGLITLKAVWEPKTDNYPTVIRTIRCGLLTIERLLLKVFGAVKDINDFQPVVVETTTGI